MCIWTVPIVLLKTLQWCLFNVLSLHLIRNMILSVNDQLFCRSYTKCANGVPKEVFTTTLNINTYIDGLFISGLLPAWSGLRSQNTHLQLARPVDGVRRLQPSCSSGRLPVSLIRGTLSIGSEVLSLPEIPRGQGPQALHHLCGRSAQTEHLHSGKSLLRGHTQL